MPTAASAADVTAKELSSSLEGETQHASGDEVLVLRHVSKSFAGVCALTDVSLTCVRGEVHALVGENGAGKSTLIKIAAGALRPDSGSVEIDGQAVKSPSPLAARRLGLLTAYQDTSLVPDLTARENLVLAFHGVRALGMKMPNESVHELIERYDLPFDLDETTRDLSPASRQLLEVVRAHMHRPKLLLLDEPTAALDRSSARALEGLLRTTLDEQAAILYISHRLDEVRRIAARLTVLRDGATQGTYVGGDWDVEEIVSLMVGAPTDLTYPKKPGVAQGARAILAAKAFSGANFGPVDLVVRAGEIVGIAGAEGNGQRELMRSLTGLRRSTGSLELDGVEATIASPGMAARAGISFQSGDRAAESVFRDLSTMANSTMPLREGLGPVGLIMRSRERRAFQPVAAELSIVHASPDQPVGELSGGNQQKVVLSRGILVPTRLWLIDEPTQGVDAKARLDIFRVLRGRAETGTAILLNSSDSSELAGLCDRVYVLSRGRIVAELEGDSLSENAIVESFVDVGAALSVPEAASQSHDIGASVLSRRRRFSVPPIAGIVLVLLALCLYTTLKTSVFLGSSNLSAWLSSALPLGIVAVGQQVALLAGEFDISIGSTMTLTVVLLSFWATGATFGSAIPGVLGVLGIGLVIGTVNGFIVRVLKVPAIIATIGTLSVISGVAIALRPVPAGTISSGLATTVDKQVAFIPIAFVVLVVVAVLADLWRSRTSSGLSFRATGLAPEASGRTGLRVGAIKVVSYLVCAVLAVVAGIFLAASVGVGSNSVGADFPLPAFTACFLGGAALTGGRGTFIGTILGALLISLLTNVTPLLQWPDAISTAATGVFTIVALASYYSRRRSDLRTGGQAPAASQLPPEGATT